MAPLAVVGSVAASNAEALRLSPALVIATISSPFCAVVSEPVVAVADATASVFADPVSNGVNPPPE